MVRALRKSDLATRRRVAAMPAQNAPTVAARIADSMCKSRISGMKSAIIPGTSGSQKPGLFKVKK